MLLNWLPASWSGVFSEDTAFKGRKSGLLKFSEPQAFPGRRQWPPSCCALGGQAGSGSVPRWTATRRSCQELTAAGLENLSKHPQSNQEGCPAPSRAPVILTDVSGHQHVSNPTWASSIHLGWPASGKAQSSLCRDSERGLENWLSPLLLGPVSPQLATDVCYNTSLLPVPLGSVSSTNVHWQSLTLFRWMPHFLNPLAAAHIPTVPPSW